MDDEAGALRRLVAAEVSAAMLVVQDIHRVHGREELPFEDAYRDQIVPALAGCGAELLFFGWAPHGAGAGYEAVVLTSVPDTASLFEYQALLAGGALADVWERLETADHELHSTLLAPTGPLPAPTDSEATVPRTLYRLDTLTIDGLDRRRRRRDRCPVPSDR